MGKREFFVGLLVGKWGIRLEVAGILIVGPVPFCAVIGRSALDISDDTVEITEGGRSVVSGKDVGGGSDSGSERFNEPDGSEGDRIDESRDVGCGRTEGSCKEDSGGEGNRDMDSESDGSCVN